MHISILDIFVSTTHIQVCLHIAPIERCTMSSSYNDNALAAVDFSSFCDSFGRCYFFLPLDLLLGIFPSIFCSHLLFYPTLAYFLLLTYYNFGRMLVNRSKFYETFSINLFQVIYNSTKMVLLYGWSNHNYYFNLLSMVIFHQN